MTQQAKSMRPGAITVKKMRLRQAVVSRRTRLSRLLEKLQSAEPKETWGRSSPHENYGACELPRATKWGRILKTKALVLRLMAGRNTTELGHERMNNTLTFENPLVQVRLEKPGNETPRSIPVAASAEAGRPTSPSSGTSTVGQRQRGSTAGSTFFPTAQSRPICRYGDVKDGTTGWAFVLRCSLMNN